jgi:hypothetical protein
MEELRSESHTYEQIWGVPNLDDGGYWIYTVRIFFFFFWVVDLWEFFGDDRESLLWQKVRKWCHKIELTRESFRSLLPCEKPKSRNIKEKERGRENEWRLEFHVVRHNVYVHKMWFGIVPMSTGYNPMGYIFINIFSMCL